MVTSCCFSNNDSKFVASVSDIDFLVKIWDTKTGKLIKEIPSLNLNVHDHIYKNHFKS